MQSNNLFPVFAILTCEKCLNKGGMASSAEGGKGME
jgi:hypothetical protein